MPEAVTAESLSDLNVEPLLLHLLILSDYCGERWTEAAENRNLVYEDILCKVHARNAAKPINGCSWSKDQFFHLMEALGIAAWRGNGRAGTEATFDAVCKRHARHLFKGTSGPQVPDMDSVILQTHARPIDGPDAGFEFIHKSFGEYLVARGLVTAAIRLHKRWTSEANEEEESYFALSWAELVRDAALTPEVIRFLYDETLRRASSSTSNAEDLHLVKRSLERILNWVQQHGFPVHKMEAIGDFRELETCQRCAEASMLAVASAIACASSSKEERVTIEWNADGALRFLERLHATSRGRNNRILSKIDLNGADINGAKLFESDLRGANLNGANLNGANLFDSDLRDADLSGADLIWTDLRGADLGGANLSGANLNGALLKSANLAKCTFAATYARLTDFSLTNLSAAQVNSIFGVKQGFGRTILPEGLEPPDFWHVAQESTEDKVELRQAFNDAARRWRAKQRSD
ncbi:pentapeptide repeat-containing protein [Rhodobacter sp. JA431]|uniref:pentapeptide repeat-containing protein n=1 Tax=Rhodobacter sp. JA431 TaxID=570013 RepID=UPI0020165172|nr:pentapeptide repeat-containing protein [Rhodobacter sp. JA431]